MKVRDKTNPLRDKPLRNPGQSLDEELDRLLNDKLLLLFFLPLLLWILSGIEWFAEWRHAPRSPGTYAIAALVVSAYCGWQFRRLLPQIKAAKLGRNGERFVGQYLEELRAGGARVFHDVLAEGFNLDHVVVSERGIFLIETKTWTKLGPESKIRVEEGRLYKNGFLENPNPIVQAAAEAAWLKQLLSQSIGKPVTVRAVVLFPGWWVEPMDRGTKDIAWVLAHKALPKWIQHEPIKFTPEEVSMIAFHLDRYIRLRAA